MVRFDCRFFGPFVYPEYATTPTAARIPIIATTTNNSIRVNPLLFFSVKDPIINKNMCIHINYIF